MADLDLEEGIRGKKGCEVSVLLIGTYLERRHGYDRVFAFFKFIKSCSLHTTSTFNMCLTIIIADYSTKIVAVLCHVEYTCIWRRRLWILCAILADRQAR